MYGKTVHRFPNQMSLENLMSRRYANVGEGKWVEHFHVSDTCKCRNDCRDILAQGNSWRAFDRLSCRTVLAVPISNTCVAHKENCSDA